MSKMIEFAGVFGPAFISPHTIDAVASAQDHIAGGPCAIIITRGGSTIKVSGAAVEIAGRLDDLRAEMMENLTQAPSILDTPAAPEPSQAEPPRVDRSALQDAETSLTEAIARFGQVGARFRITGERASACGLPAARRAVQVSQANVLVRRATQALLATAAEQL